MSDRPQFPGWPWLIMALTAFLGLAAVAAVCVAGARVTAEMLDAMDEAVAEDAAATGERE